MATLTKCHWLLEFKLVISVRSFLGCAGNFSALVYILSWVQNIELLSKEELCQKMTRAEKKGFALLLGESKFPSKVYDGSNLAALSPASCWYYTSPGISIPATLAFVPSPVLWCNFPPQGLCPRHCLCLEVSSHSSPYLPPASALLLTAQEIILCAP